MDKTIKSSKRGLTFSFEENETFFIGEHYDYVLDKKNRTIRIRPEETGRFTLSRKRIGRGFKPLIDLRNKEILSAIADMEKIRISITETEIIICEEKSKAKGRILRIPRAYLYGLRAATGIHNSEAAAETISNPDVVIGGPSCKPFSNANRHTRLEDHPNSDLVAQYIRIIKTLRPKVFAMENVPEVLTASDGTYYRIIEEAARECGYDLNPQLVVYNEVGGYTTRKRAVIIGSRIGSAKTVSPTLRTGKRTVRDALGKVNPTWANYFDVSIPSPRTKECMSFVPPGGNWRSIPAELLGNSHDRHSNSYRRLAWAEPAPTIVNWRKTSMMPPKGNRTLTVAEAKALQGLPADFHVCGTLNEMQQQLGNCVPVAIGRYIKNLLFSLLSAKEATTCMA